MYGKGFEWRYVRFSQNKDNGGNAYECSGSLGLCSVEYKEDVAPRRDEILAFCDYM